LEAEFLPQEMINAESMEEKNERAMRSSLILNPCIETQTQNARDDLDHSFFDPRAFIQDIL